MKKIFPSMLLVFSLPVTLWISGCAPAPATALPAPAQGNALASLAQVEELAGFHVLEPGYLPAGVSLESATFEETPSPVVVLHFKFVHEQYGDMGTLFEIRQQPGAEATAGALSCGETVEGCEVLQVGDLPVVYHLYTSQAGDGANTEGLEWYTGGSFFRLHRVAGEPNKIYRDELLKVLSSMK